MRRLLIVMGSLLITLILIAAAVPFFIPQDVLMKPVHDQLEKMLGKKITIAGPLHFSLLPSARISLEDVTIADNAKEETTFATMKLLRLQVAIFPLIKSKIVIEEMTVEVPQINLRVNAAGQENWLPPGASPSPSPAKKTGGSPLMAGMQLDSLRIRKGSVSYQDMKTGKKWAAEDINIEAAGNSSGGLKLEGDVVWNKEKQRFEGKIGDLAALVTGTTTPFKMFFKNRFITFDADGSLVEERWQGDMRLASSSLRDLAVWLGMPVPTAAPLALDMKAKADCGAQSCRLSEMAVTLDEAKIAGNLDANYGNAAPRYQATLVIDNLNLDSFMKTAEGWSPIAPAYAAEGWSNDPIDTAWMHGMEAKIDATVNKLQAAGLKIDSAKLHASLTGGTLTTDLSDIVCYGGKGQASASVVSGKELQIKKHIEFSSVQLEPFLTNLGVTDRISGTGNLSGTVTGSGGSQRAIVSSLNGSGTIQFLDGAIKGINLAEMARNVKSAFTGAGGGSQKTDFAEIKATFTIAQGIAKNSDLAMKAPLLRATGSGDIDLPQKYVRYRLVPEIVGTMQGQGGKEKQGLAVPILISGPFDNLTYAPDLKGLIEEGIKDPKKLRENAKETLGTIKEQLKDGKGGLKDLLKGF